MELAGNSGWAVLVEAEYINILFLFYCASIMVSAVLALILIRIVSVQKWTNVMNQHLEYFINKNVFKLNLYLSHLGHGSFLTFFPILYVVLDVLIPLVQKTQISSIILLNLGNLQSWARDNFLASQQRQRDKATT